MSVNQVVKWKQILPSSLQMYSFSRGSYTSLVLGICCWFHKYKITYFINMREHVNKCINTWLTCKNKVGHCRCLFSPFQPNLFFTALQWHCPSYKQLQNSGIVYEENFLCSTVRRSQSCSLKLIRTREELYPGVTVQILLQNYPEANAKYPTWETARAFRKSMQPPTLAN